MFLCTINAFWVAANAEISQSRYARCAFGASRLALYSVYDFVSYASALVLGTTLNPTPTF